MVAMTAVLRFARFHVHSLQMWFLQAFQPLSQLQSMKLTPPWTVRDLLLWWTDRHNLCEGAPFQPPTLTVSITMDASLWG